MLGLLSGKNILTLLIQKKDASRTRAIEIFPYFSSQLSKKKNNKADAILIASFFLRNLSKEE